MSVDNFAVSKAAKMHTKSLRVLSQKVITERGKKKQ